MIEYFNSRSLEDVIFKWNTEKWIFPSWHVLPDLTVLSDETLLMYLCVHLAIVSSCKFKRKLWRGAGQVGGRNLRPASSQLEC